MIEQIITNPQLISVTALVISMIAGLILKDIATNFVAGLMFYLDKTFNEGDAVLIDGKPSIIIKIGIRKTVFGLSTHGGYTWKFVQNSEIQKLNLEKIVINKEVQHLPELYNKVSDIESFLEKVDERFAKALEEREKQLETKIRDAQEDQKIRK